LNSNEDPKKWTSPTHLHLDDKNNLFIDLEIVQQRSSVSHASRGVILQDDYKRYADNLYV
jgi:hypothetical protein